VERRWEYSIYECSNCTVQYSVPFKRNLNDERDKKVYRRRLELVGNYLGWDHRKFLRQNIKKGGKVLEIGCGTGDFIALANKSGYRAVGVDLDKEAVLAGQNYWKTDSIFPMSVEEYFLQSNAEKFDIICFFCTMEHLENPHEIFDEVEKHLASDGYICFSTPNNDSILNKIWGKITKVDYPPHHLIRWNKKATEIFLALHGFEIVYRKTSERSLTDTIPDLFKLYTPLFIPTSILLKLSWIVTKILSPIDKIVKILVKEGRSQLIIAKLKE